jgi:hypothetical protein
MNEDPPAKGAGLTQQQAQKVLDYVADRLGGADRATVERLLEEFAGRLCGLDDIAAIKRLVVQGNDEALQHLGGLEGARGMLYLVERIGGK